MMTMERKRKDRDFIKCPKCQSKLFLAVIEDGFLFLYCYSCDTELKRNKY